MAAGRLKIDIRRKRILELLAQNGQVTVAELSGLLNATQTTIRTDLDTMAAENRLVRIPAVRSPSRRSRYRRLCRRLPGRACRTEARHCCQGAIAHSGRRYAVPQFWLDHAARGRSACARQAPVCRDQPIRAAEVLAGIRRRITSCCWAARSTRSTALRSATTPCSSSAPSARGRFPFVDGVNAAQGITTYHAEEAMVNRIMIQQAHWRSSPPTAARSGARVHWHSCWLDDRFTVITDSGPGRRSWTRDPRATGAAVEVAEET